MRCEHFHGNSGCSGGPDSLDRCLKDAALAVMDEHGKVCGAYCHEHAEEVHAQLVCWDGPNRWVIVSTRQVDDGELPS